MTIQIPTLATLPTAAKRFIEAVGKQKIFAFYGGMGAGKTTFIKALAQELDVKDTVASPTFAIINEYRIAHTDEPVFHFDFYRIKRLEEACDIGYEDYFYSGARCLIEWPERIESLLPPETVRITLSEQPDGGRLLTIDCEE